MNVEMDLLGKLLTIQQILTRCEISVELYPNLLFRCIDKLDHQFGDGAISIWTRTRCDGLEPLLTLCRLQVAYPVQLAAYLCI